MVIFVQVLLIFTTNRRSRLIFPYHFLNASLNHASTFLIAKFWGEKFVNVDTNAIWAIRTGSWHVWTWICPCSIDDTLKQGN